jgi:UMF1 family MFS transporter
LLVVVSTPATSDRVSALGYSLGYLGGGVLFALNVWMTQAPGDFGLADAGQAVRVSFVLVALWWAAFSIPVMLLVPEPAAEQLPIGRALAAGARQLVATLRRLRDLRPVWMFLLAYWLYIDGVDTVVRMAVDYGRSLGLGTGALLKALLITQFVGFPAALAYGWLGSRIGTRRAILIAILAYFGVISWGYVMNSEAEFYGLAIVIGLFQGGIQALSRSFYSRLIPAGEAGEFFGFYNMLGKFAAVIGPTLMGVVAVATGNPRLSILSIGVLLFAGGVILMRVPDPVATGLAAGSDRA